MNDFVPEHCEYSDAGCDLFPCCLRCPLTRCRYDRPGRHARKELRNEAIVRLYRKGTTVSELARRFGVSTRTVYRATNQRGNERQPCSTTTAAEGEV